MNFKASLKRRIQESGWYVRKSAGLPVGVDLSGDIRRFGIKPRCILDIGAHQGQSAIAYADSFAGSQVFAFEPVSSNFSQLMKATASRPQIIPVCAAVGGQSGKANISLHPDNSEAHSLVRKSGNQVESVDVTTIDEFCADKNIQPDIIKIDAEGFELQVLAGAKRTLTSVKAIVAEATLSSTNNRHIQLTELIEAVPGFNLAGIYDQCQWQTTGKLEFFNALFVKPREA